MKRRKKYPLLFSRETKGCSLAPILEPTVMSLQASQDRENVTLQQLSRSRCLQALLSSPKLWTAFHRSVQRFIGTYLNKTTPPPPPSSVIKHRETFCLQFLFTGFWTLWDFGGASIILPLYLLQAYGHWQYCNTGLSYSTDVLCFHHGTISKLNILKHSKNSKDTSSPTIWGELLPLVHC